MYVAYIYMSHASKCWLAELGLDTPSRYLAAASTPVLLLLLSSLVLLLLLLLSLL